MVKIIFALATEVGALHDSVLSALSLLWYMLGGYTESVDMVLLAEANLDKPTSNGLTPLAINSCNGECTAMHSPCLMTAVVRTHPTKLLSGLIRRWRAEIVKVFLQAGVDTDKPAYCDDTSLTLAAEVSAS